jgi:hypothetical protein
MIKYILVIKQLLSKPKTLTSLHTPKTLVEKEENVIFMKTKNIKQNSKERREEKVLTKHYLAVQACETRN